MTDVSTQSSAVVLEENPHAAVVGYAQPQEGDAPVEEFSPEELKEAEAQLLKEKYETRPDLPTELTDDDKRRGMSDVTLQLNGWNTYPFQDTLRVLDGAPVGIDYSSPRDRGDVSGYWQFGTREAFTKAFNHMADYFALSTQYSQCNKCGEWLLNPEYDKGGRPHNKRSLTCKVCRKRYRVNKEKADQEAWDKAIAAGEPVDPPQKSKPTPAHMKQALTLEDVNDLLARECKKRDEALEGIKSLEWVKSFIERQEEV